MRVNSKLKHYHLEKILGEGNFGSVFKAIDNKSKEYVAIKSIPKRKIKEQPKLGELIQTEIKVLKDCKNENVVKLIENFETENEIIIVMEFCNEGDFEKYMEKKKVLSEQEAVNFLKQLLNGFKGLHEINVIHRDFKIANLMMHDGSLKIGDLGFAKQTVSLAVTCLGTTLYMAPEVLKGNKKYNNKVDIWGLAVVYYQMLFGVDKYPFFANDDVRLLKEIEKGIINFKVNSITISEESKDLLARMLTMNPESRIDWSDIYSHTLIKPPAPISFKQSAPLGNNNLFGSMIKSIDVFEIGDRKNLNNQDIWESNRNFYKKIEDNKVVIDAFGDMENHKHPEKKMENDYNHYVEPNQPTFQVKKPDFNISPVKLLDIIPEDDKELKAIQKKTKIHEITKILSSIYLHYRNINSVYARVLTSLQTNPSQNINVIFPQFLLVKKMLVENKRLLDSMEKKQNIFRLEEPNDLVEAALSSDMIQKIRSPLKEEFDFLKINFEIIMDDIKDAMKSIRDLDPTFKEFLNEEDGKKFQERFKQDVFALATSINDEFHTNKNKNPNKREKLVLAIEIFNCLCPDVAFPYNIKNQDKRFDFKKYEERLDRDPIERLVTNLQETVNIIMDNIYK